MLYHSLSPCHTDLFLTACVCASVIYLFIPITVISTGGKAVKVIKTASVHTESTYHHVFVHVRHTAPDQI